MPISNDTTAVRGVANSGPMARYTAIANSVPANRPRGAVRRSIPPPTRASATTVSSGRPTPVSRKPAAACQICSPAASPALGGKMMLPAPRNSAKVMKPRATRSKPFKRVMGKHYQGNAPPPRQRACCSSDGRFGTTGNGNDVGISPGVREMSPGRLSQALRDTHLS